MATNDVTARIDIAALRALETAATPARWIAGKTREDGTAEVYSPNTGPCRVITQVAETTSKDAALIAEMRNALPALLDELELARAVGDALRTRRATDNARARHGAIATARAQKAAGTKTRNVPWSDDEYIENERLTEIAAAAGKALDEARAAYDARFASTVPA